MLAVNSSVILAYPPKSDCKKQHEQKKGKETNRGGGGHPASHLPSGEAQKSEIQAILVNHQGTVFSPGYFYF